MKIKWENGSTVWTYLTLKAQQRENVGFRIGSNQSHATVAISSNAFRSIDHLYGTRLKEVTFKNAYTIKLKNYMVWKVMNITILWVEPYFAYKW